MELTKQDEECHASLGEMVGARAAFLQWSCRITTRNAKLTNYQQRAKPPDFGRSSTPSPGSISRNCMSVSAWTGLCIDQS